MLSNLELQYARELILLELEQDRVEEDVTAQLLPADKSARALVKTREQAVLCGKPIIEELAKLKGWGIGLNWFKQEGEMLEADEVFLQCTGKVREIVSLERSILNILQTFMGVASLTRKLVGYLQGYPCCLLDTRKTIPGLRILQKYAVRQGGGTNHRMDLAEGYLIKENHIAACGSVKRAIEKAHEQKAPGQLLEIEVRNLEEYQQTFGLKLDRVMLDNFSPEMVSKAIEMSHAIPLEASGVLPTKEQLQAYARTGVDYISLGSLTKHLQAIDLSLELEDQSL